MLEQKWKWLCWVGNKPRRTVGQKQLQTAALAKYDFSYDIVNPAQCRQMVCRAHNFTVRLVTFCATCPTVPCHLKSSNWADFSTTSSCFNLFKCFLQICVGGLCTWHGVTCLWFSMRHFLRYKCIFFSAFCFSVSVVNAVQSFALIELLNLVRRPFKLRH